MGASGQRSPTSKIYGIPYLFLIHMAATPTVSGTEIA